MSGAEFRSIDVGMKKSRTHRILDTKGLLIYQGYGYMSRQYRACNPDHRMTVDYERRNGVWRMVYKLRYYD